jgi:hypothetical protein
LRALGVSHGAEVAIMAPGNLAALPLHLASDGQTTFLDH